MAREFPDVHDGDTIEPYWFNLIFNELRRWRKLKGTGGVTVTGAECGDPMIVGTPDGTRAIAVLTGGALASAASANTPTFQTATLRSFNGTTLSTVTGRTVKVFNDHDKTFANGAQIKIEVINGYWFVYDVRSCASLS